MAKDKVVEGSVGAWLYGEEVEPGGFQVGVVVDVVSNRDSTTEFAGIGFLCCGTGQ